MLEAEEQKVIIVPPRFWYRFFFTIGFYDTLHDLIVIKGELPEETFRQALAHERAHREWFLNHPLITRIYNFFFWPPGLYYILSTISVVFYLFSVGWFWPNFVGLSGGVSFVLYILYLSLHRILEIPASKAGRIVGLGRREMLRIYLVELIPVFFVLPALLSLYLTSLRGTAMIFGLGFLAFLLYRVLYLRALTKVERRGIGQTILA